MVSFGTPLVFCTLLHKKAGKSDFPAFSVLLQACFKETELFPQAVFFLLGAKGRLDGVILEPHEVLHGPIVLPGHFGKKYLAEHEEALASYRAAKAAINDILDGAKLPRMDALKKERRELAERKKKLYAQYRAAQQEMREAWRLLHHFINLTLKGMEITSTARITSHQYHAKPKNIKTLLICDKESLGLRCEVGVRPL